MLDGDVSLDPMCKCQGAVVDSPCVDIPTSLCTVAQQRAFALLFDLVLCLLVAHRVHGGDCDRGCSSYCGPCDHGGDRYKKHFFVHANGGCMFGGSDDGPTFFGLVAYYFEVEHERRSE